MAKSNASSYILAATELVETFVLEIFRYLLTQGLTTPEDGKKMAMETANLIGEVANEICILGVENFKNTKS